LKYVSLEDPSEFTFAQEDPKGFLARFAKGAVFVEAQRWPALFSYLQGMVDEDRTPGRFVLTGSQQFGLLAGITQSLAGRVGMTRLLPLSLVEIPPDRFGTLDEMLLRGGYPALYSSAVDSSDWLASYVATYVERDVRQVLEVRELMVFQRFMKLCATRTGQLLNLNALAGEAGISHSTARAWMSVLESSDIVYMLPPYHRNSKFSGANNDKIFLFAPFTQLARGIVAGRAKKNLLGTDPDPALVGAFIERKAGDQGCAAHLFVAHLRGQRSED